MSCVEGLVRQIGPSNLSTYTDSVIISKITRQTPPEKLFANGKNCVWSHNNSLIPEQIWKY